MSSRESGSSREPIFNLPATIVVSVGVLVALHAVRVWFLDPEQGVDLILNGAVVPARWAEVYGGVSADRIVAALRAAGELDAVELAPFVLESGGKPWTALTYALLHGSWAHVLVNSLWLLAFGTPVARRCGPARFALLMAVTAIGGAVGHALVHPYQTVPMIGASAAVSGMMACAAWFMFSPRVWLLEGRLAEPHERPRESFAEILRNRRVITFLLVWMATNYISAILAAPLGVTDASIAWEAHVGGFVTGLLLFPLLDPVRPHSADAPA